MIWTRTGQNLPLYLSTEKESAKHVILPRLFQTGGFEKETDFTHLLAVCTAW